MYSTKIADKCRACNSADLKTVLELNPMPPGDKYVTDKLDIPRINLPSNIQHCNSCNHIQMSGFTDPDYIYETYLSRPASTNPTLEKTYQQYARELVSLADGKPILEVGSNDGLFLSFIREAGGKAIGIEPAENLVNIANDREVQSIHDYVTEKSVRDAVKEIGEKPKVILANHSFSNVEDIQDWASHLTNSLEVDGYLVLQSFYQMDVLEKHLIENYNHEHLSYLSVTDTKLFFERYGLKLEKILRINAKGGSIRFYFKKTDSEVALDGETKELIKNESKIFGNIQHYFDKTKSYISEKSEALLSIIDSLGESPNIAAYGTSIGATVFCYQFGIENYINCFFDDDTLRQNRYSPGTGKPVLPGRSLEMNQYSHIIILAPLYADAIIKNNLAYLQAGGKFIKFWPSVEVISNDSIEVSQ